MITALSLSPAVDKVLFVPGFESGKLYRVKDTIKSAGGKGINVARVVSILNEETCLLGFIAGETGEWLQSQLKTIGIHTNFIEVEGESRTNINIIDKGKNTETEILEIGPVISEKDKKSFMLEFKRILEQTSILVCSGGLPAGIPVNFYRELINEAKAYNIKTILDTSNEILIEGIKAKPYMIKPNLRELRAFTGKSLNSVSEIVNACKDIVKSGVEVVVTSMGSKGALMVTKDEVLKADVPNVEVVNTIGSGDSTVAGCVVGLKRGYPFENVLKLGMACAVANTQFKEIGYINTELVEKYYKKIVVRRLDI